MSLFSCRVDYSWPQNDVIEIKGPLPEDFVLEKDVEIKPEVCSVFALDF